MEISKQEHERRMVFARENVAQAWCDDFTEAKVFDPELAESFAKILVEHMYKPHLGLATTRELLNEITARIEIDGNLDYKTCNGDV